MLAVVGPARLVDAADVRVLEPSQRVRLALEHADVVLIHVLVAANDFDRDLALRVLLLSLVNHTHSTLAEFREDAVVANGRRDGRRYLT